MSPHEPSGVHCLADLYGVSPELLADCTGLESALCEAARAGGAHVLFARVHSFGAGMGVTGVVLLAESHISIHTWPEAGFAAVDIFMCGEGQPAQALAALSQSLRPATQRVRDVVRGNGKVDEPTAATGGRASASASLGQASGG